MRTFQRPIIKYHFNQRKLGLGKACIFRRFARFIFGIQVLKKKLMKLYWQKLLKDIINESRRSCSTYGGLIINNFH